MRQRSLANRVRRLEAELAEDPGADTWSRNAASVHRGLRDLVHCIASDFLEPPLEEARFGFRGRTSLMIDAARELLAQGVLAPLLAQGVRDPASLDAPAMLRALQPVAWAHEVELPDPMFAELTPAEREQAEQVHQALRPYLQAETLPPAWLELVANLERLGTQGHPYIVGEDSAQPDPTFI